MKIVLQNGWVYCANAGWNAKGDVWIENGCITGVFCGERPSTVDVEHVIDCSGCWVAPGLVDVGTFCGELGFQHREDFASLTRAALAGGYTDIVLGPWGAPCIDNPAVVTDILARSSSYPVRYHTLGSLTAGMQGQELAEIGLMKRAGIVGLTDGNHPIRSSVVLRRALQYAERLDLPVFLAAEDPELRIEGVMHEGSVSTRIGLRGIPLASEEIALRRIEALERDTGAKVCAYPVGSSKFLSNTHAAISARSLLLSDLDVESDLYNPSLHVLPPLRDDPDGLCTAAQEGRIAMIFSDHIPLTRVEQECEFALSEAGAMGLETALRVAHTQIQDLSKIWELMCYAPARFLGLSKGLHVGSNTDIVIFDPNRTGSVKPPFQSKGINEPLNGRMLTGLVRATLTKDYVPNEQ